MSEISDDEKAQAASYAATDAANRGPRHAEISDEDLCKALRHRASLPETCATDAYVMLQAEQRIKLRHKSSEGADEQATGGGNVGPLGKLRPGRYLMRNGNEAQIWAKDVDGNPLYPFYGSLPESPEEDAWDAFGRSWANAGYDLVKRLGPLPPRPTPTRSAMT